MWKGLLSDMSEEVLSQVLDIATSVMNAMQFVISLWLVIVVAGCFLGRNVIFTRKQVFASFGTLIIQLSAGVILNVFFADADTEFIISLNYALTILVYIFSFVFFLFTFKEKRVKHAIESFIWFFLLTGYLSTFSQMTVMYLVGGTDEVALSIFYYDWGTGPLWFALSAIGFIVTLALFLITYFGFFRPKRYYIISIPSRILFIVWIVAFLIGPMMPAILPSEEFTIEQRYHIMSIMFGIGIIILGLAAPIFVIVSSAERSHLEKSKTQEAYLAAELAYIDQYKKKQTETRAFRHDINNQLSITQMLLEEGHTQEAKDHIRDMLGSISSLSPQYVTGDDMLDIIISMKADKMKEKNIRFTLDGVVDGGLNLKPMDKCSIFANVLDNAIEAASACEDPFISFNIKKADRFFVIKVINSASSKIDTEKLLSSTGYTSKRDKDHHGFGLMNVRRAVENNNGMLKAESADKSFMLTIMLPRELPD